MWSVWLTISVALTEIVVGAIDGNIMHLQLTDGINWLAGFGAIVLSFLASDEIDYAGIKRNFWSTMCIGFCTLSRCHAVRPFNLRLAMAAGQDRQDLVAVDH